MRTAPGGHLPPYYYNPSELPGEFRGELAAPAGGMKRSHGPPMELDNGHYPNYSAKYDVSELQG
jgi:hypothetical protein